MLSNTELSKVISKCENSLDLKNGRLGSEYFRNDIVLSLIDAVFSVGIRYTIVKNAVDRYDRKYAFQKQSNTYNEHLISDFIKNVSSYPTIRNFAESCLTTNLTSAKNGILKAEACYQIAQIFQNKGINTLADFKAYTSDSNSYQTKELDKLFMSVKGQNSGISNSYFYMLIGEEDICKPDRMLTRFIEWEIERTVTLSEVEDAITRATIELKSKYPHLTVRLLDHLIWGYQKNLV